MKKIKGLAKHPLETLEFPLDIDNNQLLESKYPCTFTKFDDVLIICDKHTQW